MTTYNSNAKPSEIKPQIVEIDKLINALDMSGNEEMANQLVEIKPAIEELIEDLSQLVDRGAQEKAQKLIAEQIAEFSKLSE
jgi:hypothetical protein